MKRNSVSTPRINGTPYNEIKKGYKPSNRNSHTVVAVAITVSVSVAYWMGGISSLYTTRKG